MLIWVRKIVAIICIVSIFFTYGCATHEVKQRSEQWRDQIKKIEEYNVIKTKENEELQNTLSRLYVEIENLRREKEAVYSELRSIQYKLDRNTATRQDVLRMVKSLDTISKYGFTVYLLSADISGYQAQRNKLNGQLNLVNDLLGLGLRYCQGYLKYEGLKKIAKSILGEHKFIDTGIDAWSNMETLWDVIQTATPYFRQWMDMSSLENPEPKFIKVSSIPLSKIRQKPTLC